MSRLLPHLVAIPVTLVACLLAADATAKEWTLERVVERARARSPEVVEARGALRSADALGRSATLPIVGNPFVEAAFETSRITAGASIATRMYVPIEVGGQRGARIAEWERLTEWRGRSLSLAQARATADGIAAYAGATLAEARVSLARTGAADAAAEVENMSARLRAGDVTVHALSLAEAEAARWSQLRAEAEVERAYALARLGQLVGEPVGEGIPSPTLPMLVRTWSRADVADRARAAPVVRALEAEAVLWQATAERSKREIWAPLQVVATAGRGDLGEPRAGGGLAWTLPMTQRNQGAIARAQAESSRALDLGASALRTTEVQLGGLIDAYASARRGVEAQDGDGIPSAERAVLHTASAYRAGKAEFIAVLSARRDLAAAKSRRLDLLQGSWAAYAALASIVGELP